MERPVLVTVYTQVYNTKPWLRQCIESVLTQTYPHFEYYVVDNGSTDGCKEILEEYAAADPRIRLIRSEENMLPPPGGKICVRECQGQYYTVLDSDDWWEPDFLEKLISLAESQGLDIVCAGTVMHDMASGTQGVRAVERTLVFSREEFPEYFPWYHAFFRPPWGKLIRIEYVRAVQKISFPALSYGVDTLVCFQYLREARRVGISGSVLQHYRINQKSISYQYSPDRFQTDIYLYNDAVDFLSGFGPVSAQNRNFIQCVYSNAVIDTTGVIQGSSLSPAEKLREYRTIAENPITLAAYRECTFADAARSKMTLIHAALKAGTALGKQDDNDLRAVMQTHLPRCGRTVSGADAELFLEDPALLRALLQDDADSVLDILLERLAKSRGEKRYALPEAVCALAADDPLLCQINDAVFLRNYAGIYRKLWKGDRLAALDEMVGLLLENKVRGGRKTFLNLLVSLAALEEQASAFVFGEIQLAWLYLRQGQRDQAHAVVADLTEMGVENEELEKLRKSLERQ